MAVGIGKGPEKIPQATKRGLGILLGRMLGNRQLGDLVTPQSGLGIIATGDANTAVILEDRCRGDSSE